MFDWNIPETAEVHPTNNHHKPMKISIEFNTDNAAFIDNPDEAGRILRQLASEVSENSSGIIRDHNGNTIGRWSWNA